jgi:hypothetical protein
MYTCNLPEDLDINFHLNEPQQEDLAIVILDTNKVYEYALLNKPPVIQNRMKRVHEMLAESKFIIPVILLKENGIEKYIEIADGRHRTNALYETSEEQIPFLTLKIMSNEIFLKLGSSKKIVNFDFSNVPSIMLKP